MIARILSYLFPLSSPDFLSNDLRQAYMLHTHVEAATAKARTAAQRGDV
jgi:hypothetical protein